MSWLHLCRTRSSVRRLIGATSTAGSLRPASSVLLNNGYSTRRRTYKFDKEETARMRRPSAGAALLLLIPVTFLTLGVWQTRRRTWKLNLIADLREKTTAEVIPLPTDPAQVSELEYRRVRVRGRFDHSKEIYIGPKSQIKANEQGNLFGSSDSAGFFVVTALDRSDTDADGQRILLNRGWVPKARLSPHTRQAGQVDGEVEFVGIVRKNETREVFTPKNQPDGSDRWPVRDVNALAQVLRASPIFVDADADSTVKEGPIGGQTRVHLRNDHFSYMLTWYSLSAATFYMWLKKFSFIK